MNNECYTCDCYDPDLGCTMPDLDKEYACAIYCKDNCICSIEKCKYFIGNKCILPDDEECLHQIDDYQFYSNFVL